MKMDSKDESSFRSSMNPCTVLLNQLKSVQTNQGRDFLTPQAKKKKIKYEPYPQFNQNCGPNSTGIIGNSYPIFKFETDLNMPKKLDIYELLKGECEAQKTRALVTENFPNLQLLSRKFNCPGCDFKCILKSDFRVHMLKHEGVELFKCTDCDYECKQRSQLRSHFFNRHSSIKLFKCSECSYECKQKGQLKAHLFNRHSDLKLFKCPECNYKCKQKGQLKAHVFNRHSDVKLFKCSQCSYECKQKGQLKTHAIYHHSENKLLHCMECSYQSNKKTQLQKHIEKDHPQNKLKDHRSDLENTNNRIVPTYKISTIEYVNVLRRIMSAVSEKRGSTHSEVNIAK